MRKMEVTNLLQKKLKCTDISSTNGFLLSSIPKNTNSSRKTRKPFITDSNDFTPILSFICFQTHNTSLAWQFLRRSKARWIATVRPEIIRGFGAPNGCPAQSADRAANRTARSAMSVADINQNDPRPAAG
ncbi:unnamed protein product, partial [Nesidiocoris tenuis]